VRLAIAVQRYGDQVVGGAERHSRLLAEKLAQEHDVTILTTCAVDYRTWANELPAGSEVRNGVQIIRWGVEKKRRWRYFGWQSRKLFSSPHSVLDEYQWIVSQGPECPKLIEYILAQRAHFDLFLFFTYLYYPTFFGLPLVAEKSILVPTAHDEPAIRLEIFNSLFHLPRFIAFNTDEEKRFVHAVFKNDYIPSATIGVGIDLERVSNRDYGYLLYMGRVENGKNCEELFQFSRNLDLPLKVIGQAQIPVPKHVEYLGFVSEERKRQLLAECRAVVLPSRNESLSLAVLEAWAHGKPVIVSDRSPILRTQVEKSGGGYAYRDANDFCTIAQNVDAARGLAGRKYVEQNYSWANVLAKYEKVFASLMNCRKPSKEPQIGFSTDCGMY
jgi:glycosyltransferase involved in cell wall biosynthesis